MKEYEILDGPNKFDFMSALFYGNSEHREVVSFELAHKIGPLRGNRELRNVIINQVNREDNSGESWNFTGYVAGDHTLVTGYYHSERKQGILKEE